MEGFWDINENTKIIKEKYQKEFNVLKKFKNLNINDKTAITILIIYYINKEHPELLKELSLIILKEKIILRIILKILMKILLKKLMHYYRLLFG